MIKEGVCDRIPAEVSNTVIGTAFKSVPEYLLKSDSEMILEIVPTKKTVGTSKNQVREMNGNPVKLERRNFQESSKRKEQISSHV